MAQLSSAEHALLDDLLEYIATAMRRLDGVDPQYATKTKLQKLCYLAVDEFDLPLTYSWYLAGAVVPGDAATPAGLQSAFDNLPGSDEPTTPSPSDDGHKDENEDPVVLNNLATSVAQPNEDGNSLLPNDPEDAPVDPVLFFDAVSADTDPSSSSTDLGDRRDEIIDFYESAILEVWHQNTMQFLQNFYLEHAPPTYRDLYVQSTHLRTRLRAVETAIATHLEGKRPTRSIDEIVTAVGLDISDLHCTIRSSDSLAATFDGFVRGTDLIEDGLLMLAACDPESLEQDHLLAVRSIQDFFYYYVWRYPCLIISQETASGPSADLLRTRHQNRLTSFEDELEREIDRFERELAAAGLIPDHTDYPSPNDDVTETITSLAEHYLE